MGAAEWILLAYIALTLYDAGMSWVLQLMHYPLYHEVGAREFSNYLRLNNQRAVIPAILPAVATLVASVLMIWRRPIVVPPAMLVTAVFLNVVVLISTAVWQGRLHGRLAQVGKVDAMINLLVTTSWIRTVSFTVQAVFAVWTLSRVLERS